MPRAFTPRCTLVPESTRYPSKVVRGLRFDSDGLTIDIQGDGFRYARVRFAAPLGFRVLDEAELTEFWNTYSEPNGWLWEVHAGGWRELESERERFLANPRARPGLREFLLVDEHVIQVLTEQAPVIEDLGA